MKPVPPPLPPRARKPPLPPGATLPVPTEDGSMSTRAKMSLADIALALREEQVQARVVHYRAELATSPELDAITAQVVAELQQLQKAAAHKTGQAAPAADRAQIEIELIKNLKVSLGHLFRADKRSGFIERKLAEVSKRFARFFFESELHEKMSGSKPEPRKIRYAEQALYLALSRAEPEIDKLLAGFEYTSPEVLERSRQALSGAIKEYRNDFLGRTTPELNALVKILNEVLLHFFMQELPPALGEIAWEVVREARLAEGRLQAGYKVSAEAFPGFRQAFERRFLQRLVTYAEDEMLKRVVALGDKFRVETIRFVAEPQIFSDVCDLICDAVYDSLYNDGFLDLPSDWRARLASGSE